jgi:hypothetical protein
MADSHNLVHADGDGHEEEELREDGAERRHHGHDQRRPEREGPTGKLRRQVPFPAHVGLISGGQTGTGIDFIKNFISAKKVSDSITLKFWTSVHEKINDKNFPEY